MSGMSSSEPLSRAQCNALRGIAIAAIVLHNYCHWLGFAVKENEYRFFADRPALFMDKLLSWDGDLFVHFFSFLGHYGVPLFLFLSGYGLVRKYEQGVTPAPAAWRFLVCHYLKLLRLMIIGYVVFIGVYCLRSANAAEVFSADRVAAQLTMVINFVYAAPDRVIRPGPYWFFGLMMQLYALYILLLYRNRKTAVALAVVVACCIVQMLCATGEALNYARYNFVGGALPFVAGILFARHGRCRFQPRPMGRFSSRPLIILVCLAVILVSAAAVLYGGMLFETWLWVPLFVVVGAIATVRLLPAPVLRGCAWLGGLSATLFVVHPLIREMVITHYRHIDIYCGLVVYALAAIAGAMLLRFILAKLPDVR